MRPTTIRWRLMLAGAVAILIALGLSAVGLSLLFERHVERVAVNDLEARARALAGIVETDPAGRPFLHDPPSDPLYHQPYSGHYWQISLGTDERRSRSLWDFRLTPPAEAAQPGATRVLSLPGPQGERLLVLEQSLLVRDATGAPLPLRILVATERTALQEAKRDFVTSLLPFLGILAALLLAAFWMQIRIGLQPLSQVSKRVTALNSGQRARIGTDLPDEVVPLSRQIDQLLDARDVELDRARHRAADLAHGFKTPLQALLGDADKLRDQGKPALADSIETVVVAMRRLVDRELTRARIQSDRSSAEASPDQVINRVVKVLKRTPLGSDISWQTQTDPGLLARIDADDLTEAMGALLENAMRHAQGAVSVTAERQGGQALITIRDDGPGVPEAALSKLARRGVRLDESSEGDGIGLAIVADIVDAADGEVSFQNADPGLLVQIRLHAR